MTLLSIFQTCFLKQGCLSCEDGLHFLFLPCIWFGLKQTFVCAHFTWWFRLLYINICAFHYLLFSQPAEAVPKGPGRQKTSTNVEKVLPRSGIYFLSFCVIFSLCSSTDRKSYLALSAVMTIVVLCTKKHKDLKLFLVL